MTSLSAHYPPMRNGEETARLLARTEVFADLEERELEEVAQVAVPRQLGPRAR